MANLKSVAKKYSKLAASRYNDDMEYFTENLFTVGLYEKEYQDMLKAIRSTKNFADIQKEFPYDAEDKEAEEDVIVNYVQKVTDSLFQEV